MGFVWLDCSSCLVPSPLSFVCRERNPHTSACRSLAVLTCALPPRSRLSGLPPRSRLSGLPPRSRLSALPPRSRLSGLVACASCVLPARSRFLGSFFRTLPPVRPAGLFCTVAAGFFSTVRAVSAQRFWGPNRARFCIRSAPDRERAMGNRPRFSPVAKSATQRSTRKPAGERGDAGNGYQVDDEPPIMDSVIHFHFNMAQEGPKTSYKQS